MQRMKQSKLNLLKTIVPAQIRAPKYKKHKQKYISSEDEDISEAG